MAIFSYVTECKRTEFSKLNMALYAALSLSRNHFETIK